MMTGVKTLERGWSRFRLEVLTLIFLLIFYIWSLVLTPFTLFFLIYKRLVILFARLLRPDLTHTLSGGNCWVALENIKEHAKANVIICFTLDAPFELEKSIELFQKNVLEKRKARGKDRDGHLTGPLIYPELQQVYSEFGGYFFWKDESNFKIREHVRVCDYEYEDLKWKGSNSNSNSNQNPNSNVCSEEDLRVLTTRLLSQPWKSDFSPWEMLCIPQYQSQEDDGNKNAEDGNSKTKSALIVRFHHVMGDGKGWLTLLLEDVLHVNDLKMARPTTRSSSVWSHLLTPIKLPYDFIKNQVESIAPNNPWHTMEKRSKEYYTSFSPPFSSQYVKDIKNKLGVGYNAVLISAISGGLRRVMEKGGQKVPDKMIGAVAVPLPDHPGGTRIHAALMMLSWPVGIADAKNRLHIVNKEIQAHKNSLAPLGQTLFFVKLFAIYPNFVRRMMYNKTVTSLGVSLFPGPIHVPEVFGAKIIDSFLLLGLPAGQCGVGIWTVVVGGRGRVVANIDKALFPSKTEFEKLGDYIFDELRVLHDTSAESFTINSKNCKENIV